MILILNHLKIDKDNSEMNLDIELEDNSLFIMAGAIKNILLMKYQRVIEKVVDIV